ncbi:MAG: tetratricopeptide repeat protein [Bacteroidia bacterium]
MKSVLLFVFFISAGILCSQNRNIDSLKAELKKPHPDTLRFRILVKLMLKTEKINLGDAAAYTKPLLETGAKIGGLHWADANYYTGRIFSYQGLSDSAIARLQKSIALYKQAGQEKGLAQAYNIIASAYIDKTDLKTALGYYLQALSIKEKLGDRASISNTLGNIGNVYDNMGNNNEALVYFNRAAQIKLETHDSIGYATCINNASMIYNRLKKHGEALRTLYAAKAICDSADYLRIYAAILGNLGETYHAMQNFKMAEKYSLQCLAIHEQMGDSTEICYTYITLANSYNEEKRYAEAIRYSSKARRIAEASGWISRLYDACISLANSYYELGNYKLCADNMMRVSALYDSVYNEQNTKAINELAVKYESEKKDAELKLNSEKLLNQQLEIKRQNTLKLSFAAGLILAIAGIAFVFRSYVQKRRANDIISLQKQQVEHQRALLEEKNNEITDSIHYAKRIQTSLITSEKYIEKALERLNKGNS